MSNMNRLQSAARLRAALAAKESECERLRKALQNAACTCEKAYSCPKETGRGCGWFAREALAGGA